MPKYFFNIHHGAHTRIDHDGVDLPNRDAAWEEATSAAGEILRDIDGDLKPGQDWRMEVSDQFKKPVFVLQISAKIPK